LRAGLRGGLRVGEAHLQTLAYRMGKSVAIHGRPQVRVMHNIAASK
jgi:hypothetical protein